MAEIILVHGIDQQQKSADLLESHWLPALAGGIRVAGYPTLADRIWRQDSALGNIETRMAFYGDVFLKPGQQGDDPGDFSAEETEFAEILATEWLQHIAERASKGSLRDAGSRELAYVTGGMGDEQGCGAAKRSAIASLARIPWFAPYGMGLAQRFVNRALIQVTRYFTDEAIRSVALDSVVKLIGPETKIIIGHSLGSIVAYEAAHLMTQPLSLLLTLGSPLGLQTIVYQRLRPQPPCFPPNIRLWTNIADREDFIAAEPDLKGLFGTPLQATSTFKNYVVDNGAAPHKADSYLSKTQVGEAVGRVICIE